MSHYIRCRTCGEPYAIADGAVAEFVGCQCDMAAIRERADAAAKHLAMLPPLRSWTKRDGGGK